MEFRASPSPFILQAQEILWRLVVILFPWQIRWFSSAPIVSGYPWEQGRLAFYASWIPMVVFVVFALADRMVGAQFIAFRLRIRERWLIGLIFVFLSSFFSLYPRATIEWWVQILLLAGFVWACVRFRVSVQSFAAWFAISLVPHAFLGLWQFITQVVVGSKWLGIAAQAPATMGASVIQQGAERVLRAYGGFPHPNIFGGWLAIGLLVCIWLFFRMQEKKKRIFWCFVSVFLSSAFVLTFSRSAWLAFGLGLCVLVILERARFNTAWKKIVIPLIILAVTMGGVLLREHSLLTARVSDATRLEQRSMDERSKGLVQGWRLFLQHPLFGVGPGVTAFALQSQLVPHNVPLLMLDEFGLLGVFGFVLILVVLTRKTVPLLERGIESEQAKLSRGLGISILAALIGLSLFDHYLWSLWAGQSLVFIGVYLMFKRQAEGS